MAGGSEGNLLDALYTIGPIRQDIYTMALPTIHLGLNITAVLLWMVLETRSNSTQVECTATTSAVVRN